MSFIIIPLQNYPYKISSLFSFLKLLSNIFTDIILTTEIYFMHSNCENELYYGSGVIICKVLKLIYYYEFHYKNFGYVGGGTYRECATRR